MNRVGCTSGLAISPGALVVLRIIWGFIGPEHARFASFVTGPREVLNYLAALMRFSSRRYVGHSPALRWFSLSSLW